MFLCTINNTLTLSVAGPGFQVGGGGGGGGGALKKIAPSGGRQDIFWGISCEKITILRLKIIFFPIAEGGAKFVGVFRVKNHDLTPKNHIFSNCRERRENIWGISCEKSRFYAKKSYFFQF